MARSAKRSIGQVLPLLKSEFPDISISKIRYLESEGLIAPERTSAKYRLYAESDVERLRYILRMQRDHYLPLKVIRQNLELMDQGLEPPTIETPKPQERPERPKTEQPDGPRVMKFTRRELIKASAVPEATLIEMERQKMIAPRPGSMYYGREALTLCVVARKLHAYGMSTRQLRAIKQAAELEAGLIEQAVAPQVVGRGAAGAKIVREVSQLVVHAHAAMMYTMLER